MGCGASASNWRAGQAGKCKYEVLTTDKTTSPDIPDSKPATLPFCTSSTAASTSPDEQEDTLGELNQTLHPRCVGSACPVKRQESLRSTDLKEVLQVLEKARFLRHVPHHGHRFLNLFAESAEIEEYPAGSTIRGPLVWTTGQRLVLSGSASITMSWEDFSTNRVEVASLQKGDSFGWPHSAFGQEEGCLDAWERCDPCVVTSPNEAFRVAVLANLEEVLSKTVEQRTVSRRRQDPNVAKNYAKMDRVNSKTNKRVTSKGYVSQGSLTSGGELATLRSLEDCFARLWLTTSASLNGVAEVTVGLVRAHFQAALWAPILDRFEDLSDEIRRRKQQGYRIHDCFPLQGHQIVELKDHVKHLTNVWYGAKRGGNISAMYSWFCEAMDLLGVTAYNYEAIPKEVSPDGWATVVDGAARAAALKGKGHWDSLYVSTGGLAQRQGRSAIDNTVLRNVFMPHEAQEMLAGRYLRKFLCKFIQLRQRCIMRRLADAFELDLVRMSEVGGSGRSHRKVKSILACISPEELADIGVDSTGTCYQILAASGSILAGYGQLSAAMQKVVWENVRLLMVNAADPDEYRGEPRADSEDYIERFVAWCRDFPGEYFQKSKALHVQALIGAAWAKKIVIIRRSAMERMTLARYVPLPWKRTQPLWGYNQNGPMVIRASGVKEGSNVRANECPYASLHGMSLSAGGFASDTRCGDEKSVRKSYTLLMEMQWIRDPKANIENWYITDIEKIIQEAYQMNPHGPLPMVLPGERFINVGQNPKVGSSIRQTQHTQLCQGSLKLYPILQIPSKHSPRRLRDSADATLEVVEVLPKDMSPEHAGIMIRVVAANPTSPAVVKFLVDLRFHLLSHVDGAAEAIDFLVTAVSDENGKFVVIFAPIAQLFQLDDQHPDLATWANPLTGESSEAVGLQETRIDFGKGVGHFLVAKPALRAQLLDNGEDTLRRIWAFNRIPGIQNLIEEFIVKNDVLANNTTE